jgi:hypothetical protein
MRQSPGEEEVLRQDPAVRAARVRERLPRTVVFVGLLVVPVGLAVGASQLRSNPPAGAAATTVETAVLLAAGLGPVLLAVGCLWWWRRARARRGAEDVVIAGWPSDFAAWYRHSRGPWTWWSRSGVAAAMGVTLMVVGAVTGSFHSTGLRVPLGLQVLSRLGLVPWESGLFVFFGGLISCVAFGAYLFVHTLGRPRDVRLTGPDRPRLVLPPQRRQRRWVRPDGTGLTGDNEDRSGRSSTM